MAARLKAHFTRLNPKLMSVNASVLHESLLMSSTMASEEHY
jgi:hypothetical protein